MDVLARAMAQIAAIGEAERAFAALLAGDRRYQFLIETARENAVEFHEEDYGWGGFDRIANYHQSFKAYRRQRALKLAHIRKAYLFNGCRCFEKYDATLRDWRKEEQHRTGISRCFANLAGVDAALKDVAA